MDDVFGGDGFYRNIEFLIFLVDILERNVFKGYGLVIDVVVGNNVFLVGINKGWIVWYDFYGGNDIFGECYFKKNF